MAPKRQSGDNGGKANKRAKPNQVSGEEAEFTPGPQRKVARSGNKKTEENMRKFELRQIPPLTEPNGFPCFGDGDVLIILEQDNPRYQYRLHSGVLRRFGFKFEELFSMKFTDVVSEKKVETNGMGLSFCLELTESVSGGELMRKSLFTKVLSNPPVTALMSQRDGKEARVSFGHDGTLDTSETLPAGTVSPLSPPPTPSINNPDMANMSCRSPEASVPSMPRPSGVIASTTALQSATAQQDEDQSSPKGITLEHGNFSDSGRSYGQSQVKNNQAQNNSQPDIEYSDSAISLKKQADTIEATLDSTTLAPWNETTPPAVAIGSLDPNIEMQLDTYPDMKGPGPMIAVKGYTAKTERVDNESPFTEIHSGESCAVNMSTERKTGQPTLEPTLETPLNTLHVPNSTTETPSTSIHLSEFPRVNSVRFADHEKVTSGAVKVENNQVRIMDDDCQITSIKNKGATPVPITPADKKRSLRKGKVMALHSLFLMAYSKAPLISQTAIKSALQQSETLINTATDYGALDPIIAPIGNSLAQHGRLLHQSIASDPIRWIKISIPLKNAMIFQEAMIHLVGTFPDKGGFAAGLFSEIPDKVMNLVSRKVDEQDRKVSRVNELLLSSSVYEANTRTKFEGENRSLEVCFVVHFWRDWFCESLAKAKTTSRSMSTEGPNIQSKLGMLYRTLSAGGDAYLPEDKVVGTLRSLHLFRQGKEDKKPGALQWETAAFDLCLMKTYASEIVQKICKNESQLSPSEAGFTYLTCTRVLPNELPWAEAPKL